MVIKNANILTLDEQDSRKGSLAVTDGRISGLWEEAEPPSGVVLMEKAKVMDVEGKTVIPGFIDTHNHLLAYAMNKNQINCSTPPNNSIQDLLENIRLQVEDNLEEHWIQGYGYDDTLLKEQRHPTRSDLDKVAPNHPVLLTHTSSHFGVVNSRALEVAGITEDTPDPEGGHFGRDEDGRLNGILYEVAALESVNKVIPTLTNHELIALIGEGAQDYVAQGITSNTDAAVGIFPDGSDIDVHTLAAKKGVNPMRTELMVMDHLLEDSGMYSEYTAEKLNEEIKRLSNGKVFLNSAKLFQDGSIQGYTGALREPYYNDPDVYGELLHSQTDFNAKVLALHERGFRIATHGNGDKAIGSILEAYENALVQSPREDHRHRIEHVQTATTTDIEEMATLKVAGSVFINHVYYWGDRHKEMFLGPKRAANISPLASMKEHDVLFTLHSDCPVTPISPLFSVWEAVNRCTSSGEVLGPEERIDVITALKSMTIYGAQLNFTEDRVGSIEEGKYADFAILDRDPTQVDPMEIKDINVKVTIINGQTVYKQE